MNLRPIDKSFATANNLFELVGAPQRCLVKIYRGGNAAARRNREQAALEAWRQAGLDVPETFDYPLEEISEPYLVMSYLAGESLRQLLCRPNEPMGGKLETWAKVLRTLRRRHDIAIDSRQLSLIHPDSSTGNVMLTDDGVFFMDLEAEVKFADAAEAAAVELAKLCRWAVRDVGMAHCDEMLEKAVAAYKDRPDVLQLIISRVKSRPMQFFHRRRDRRKKAAKPGEVTKYDIADAFEKLVGN